MLSRHPLAAMTRKLRLCKTWRYAICQASPWMGVKGNGIRQWLSAQDLSVPMAANSALRQESGSLIAMLADNEALILAGIESSDVDIGRLSTVFQNDAQSPEPPAGLFIPRQHSQAWFCITGSQLSSTLAKICAIDLRTGIFDNLRVAQTSVARLNAIIIRDDLADISAIHLLADSASACYLWDCIMDAGAEHGMRVVGLNALRALNRS